jgi:hypothetical protein
MMTDAINCQVKVSPAATAIFLFLSGPSGVFCESKIQEAQLY